MNRNRRNKTDKLPVRPAALAIVLAVPLAGCMSSGGSSPTDPLMTSSLDVAEPQLAQSTHQPASALAGQPAADGAGDAFGPTQPSARNLVAASANGYASSDPTQAGAGEGIGSDGMQAMNIDGTFVRQQSQQGEGTRVASLDDGAVLAALDRDVAAQQAAYALPADDSQNLSLADREFLAEQRITMLYPQIKHSVCEGGWATQPDKLDAQRITAGHPYYLEMRLRHTPLLPVGHTYIAYGRLGPDGNPIDEHVVMLSPVGGYGGAAIASAVPMPGVLGPVPDDCRIKPIAAYRVSLSAEGYEKLLQRVQQAHSDKPAYSLFTYNCNHFASDIVEAVGIRPPRNKYVSALQYIYGVIEENEGYNPKKQRS